MRQGEYISGSLEKAAGLFLKYAYCRQLTYTAHSIHYAGPCSCATCRGAARWLRQQQHGGSSEARGARSATLTHAEGVPLLRAPLLSPARARPPSPPPPPPLCHLPVQPGGKQGQKQGRSNGNAGYGARRERGRGGGGGGGRGGTAAAAARSGQGSGGGLRRRGGDGRCCEWGQGMGDCGRMWGRKGAESGRQQWPWM